MTTKELFSRLWEQYCNQTPSAEKIKKLFESKGENIHTDHIAFRTTDHPKVNIEHLAKPFLELGYEPVDEYYFSKKKLYAKHFEHSTLKNFPKIFISQLITSEFSENLQNTLVECIDAITEENSSEDPLVLKSRLWGTPSLKTYQDLLKESEYAAWLYVNGYCPNHFTIDVNQLQHFSSLLEVNSFLKENGFQLNTSGGEIKGSAEEYLEQSSTLADKIQIQFEEKVESVASCYYEFAYRYKKPNGELFSGFVTNSANKIFESTDSKTNNN
jgi:hypothetical protein